MNEIRQLLTDAHCVLEGEFFFALKKRGLVSKKYINLDPLLTRPVALTKIARALIAPFKGEFEVLIGPAIGGIPLVYIAAASLLNEPCGSLDYGKITTSFVEKDGDGFKFDRMGFVESVRGRRALILEDISSTGTTSEAVRNVVELAGGIPIGLSLIWNRGGLTAEQLGFPRLTSLISEQVETWHVDEKPPGWGELPLVADIGHPEYFRDYSGPKISLLV